MKIYEVRLIVKTVQVKYVQAESEEQAYKIADKLDWNGKEEVLDTETNVEIAKPDEYEHEYIHTEDGVISNKELKK